MTKEQEEAIERVNKLLELEVTPFNNGKSVLISKTDLETVLNMLKENSAELAEKSAEIEKKDKKDKIIDLMAEIFYKRFKAELLLEYGFESEEQLKQYFERKVRDERN